MKKLKISIIGTGKIATDLLLKLLKEDFIEVVAFVGRRVESEGVKVAQARGVPTFYNKIDYFIENGNCCDVVYDCTNAETAKTNAKVFADLGIKVVDLTPAKIGVLCVPLLNKGALNHADNVNLITCGGQSSIPIFYLIAQYSKGVSYMEMVSIVASKGVGMATRINVDEYIHTTERAIREFAGVENVKVILNINPAEPCIDMQTTLFAKVEGFDLDGFEKELELTIKKLNTYLPFYKLIVPPIIRDSQLMLNVKIRGAGDYLPAYAGNLDIINCSAIQITKQYYEKGFKEKANHSM